MNSVTTTPDDMAVKLEKVNALLHDYCIRQAAAAGAIAEDYEHLWSVIDTCLAGGGKRLRPRLVLLAYEAYGQPADDTIITAAAAWEMLHFSMLVHDDIMDKDDVRHGTLNVAGMYKQHYKDQGAGLLAEHLALSAAIMAGDLMLSGAYRLTTESQLTAERQVMVMRRLGDTINQVTAGQILDTEAVIRKPETVDTETINLYKTATYTFVNPLQSGAELAGASIKILDALRRYGVAVGIGYQLADDLLDVFGDPVVTGKPVGRDIREGKRTLLLQESLKLLSSQDQAELYEIIGSPLGNYEDARRLIEKSGAREIVIGRINGLYQEAMRALDDLDWPAHAVAELTRLADKSLHRHA